MQICALIVIVIVNDSKVKVQVFTLDALVCYCVLVVKLPLLSAVLCKVISLLCV